MFQNNQAWGVDENVGETRLAIVANKLLIVEAGDGGSEGFMLLSVFFLILENFYNGKPFLKERKAYFAYKDTYRLKINGWRKIIPC